MGLKENEEGNMGLLGEETEGRNDIIKLSFLKLKDYLKVKGCYSVYHSGTMTCVMKIQSFFFSPISQCSWRISHSRSNTLV